MTNYTAFRILPNGDIEVRMRLEHNGIVGHGGETVAPGETYAGLTYDQLAAARHGRIVDGEHGARIEAHDD